MLFITYNINNGVFFFSSRRRHTRSLCDWSSDVCSSDLELIEYQSSELSWPDEISIMVTTTKEYFKKKPLILRVNAKELDLSQEDFVTITQYDLPKLNVEFTPFEGARTQFYFNLFRNIAVRLVADFYSEF